MHSNAGQVVLFSNLLFRTFHFFFSFSFFHFFFCLESRNKKIARFFLLFDEKIFSGSFGVESVVQTSIPKEKGEALVLSNGAYGDRISKMCTTLGIKHILHSKPWNETFDVAEISKVLRDNAGITNVFMVHHETTSGILVLISFSLVKIPSLEPSGCGC